MRVRIDLAYDGSGFSGWAAQPGPRTVQGDLERALSTRCSGSRRVLTVAGRTDAGVHARGQVAHVDLRGDAADAHAAAASDDGLLPKTTCACTRVSLAPPGFDARFSAVWRRYAYRISDAATPSTRCSAVTCWPGRGRLDDAAMNEAAAALLGEHDFAAFCKRREGATTIRTLLELAWARERRPASGRRCVPTRSATTWCAPWSARWSPSERAGAAGLGRRGVLAGVSATRP